MPNRIYFDSCAFLAWLNGEEGHASVMGSLFEEAKKGDLQILTSTLTISEVLHVKGHRAVPKESREKIRLLFRNEWIISRGVSRRIAEVSQDLFWENNIAPKDGIHIATALVFNVGFFYTYDIDLVKRQRLETTYGTLEISEPLPPQQGNLSI